MENKENSSEVNEVANIARKIKVLWGLVIGLVVVWLISVLAAGVLVFVLVKDEANSQKTGQDNLAPVQFIENTAAPIGGGAPVSTLTATPAASADDLISSEIIGVGGLYVNEQYDFSFSYPESVYLKEWVSGEGTFVFMDNQAFEIPSAWGGPLTPLELRIDEDTTLDKKYDGVRDLFNPATINRPRYTQPVNGVKITGALEGFMDGEHMTYVLIEAGSNVLTFSFMDGNLHNFSEDLVDQIVNSVQFGN